MHLTHRLVSLLALLAVAAIFLVACGDDNGDDADPDKVTFMPGFKPQANLPFVGAYVADVKGFFTDQDLDVEIQHVSQPGENFRFLALDEVQFTTGDAAALLERRGGDPPLPLVSIALVGQRGQQGFAVLADSGIESPGHWEGKLAGYKGSKPTPDYLAILAAEGVDRSKIDEVRVLFAPTILTEGEVDIFPVFLSNEPDTIRGLGHEVTLFEAADYGAPTLGLSYVATEDYITENPDIVRRFLKAVLRGIQYSDENRDEAVDIVMQFAPQEDPDHQRFMLETELDAALTGEAAENGVGWQTGEQWRALHDWLVDFDALTTPLDDPADAFTDEFLGDIYRDGELVWP
jgi:ABC-type nitrate/sulfonate/bicarbonate transport system substrate-binding protein